MQSAPRYVLGRYDKDFALRLDLPLHQPAPTELCTPCSDTAPPSLPRDGRGASEDKRTGDACRRAPVTAADEETLAVRPRATGGIALSHCGVTQLLRPPGAALRVRLPGRLVHCGAVWWCARQQCPGMLNGSPGMRLVRSQVAH